MKAYKSIKTNKIFITENYELSADEIKDKYIELTDEELKKVLEEIKETEDI